MKKAAWLFALSFVLLVHNRYAHAFCGFYVAKADTKIFNKASQVVLARQDDKTVITMVNDFKGDPKEFAVVIPVPTLIERGQINIGDKILEILVGLQGTADVTVARIVQLNR